MTEAQRVARFSDRMFDRLRDKRAFTLTDDNAIDGDFESLRGLQVRDAGKVKRLRNDSRAPIALSNIRGKPTGPAIRGTGRVLPEEEWAHAEATLVAAYGTGRRISERVLGGPEGTGAYVEITPGC
jgi:hypothetical protein